MKWLLVPIAGVVAWNLPVSGHDATFDWLMTWASIHSDPSLPLDQLAAMHGIAWPELPPGPRLPGAYILMLPLLLAPVEWMADLGPALAAATIMGSLLYLRSVWWVWLLVAIPAAHAVWYGQASTVVTLLLAVWWARRSGVALGLATVLRAWPWFIGFGLFVAGRRREAVTAGLVFVGLNTVGLLLPGVSTARTVDGLGGSMVWADSAQNLVGLVPWWLLAVCAVLSLWRARREIRWVVVGGLMLSPVVWLHYLTVLMVPIGKPPRPVRGEGAEYGSTPGT